ncbi:MAG: phosphate/phosphite/phosphonate ABC transporter substrate-binding protein [Bdellovibrionales bacterium]|jgi:phosphonate transport system substrate-binding protein|nr:phosphate/phosphite/phosphonate ABC transporter substrate-binding protein [Bdellovibrionales bacterium]MBT3526348.1 phosphate/phosphite/phosphonate ABC transporter substrate-binding protein [Bdellovibrionales bacterium]MBT7766031.1 phosphate/phosphite/phosphonate ABC transporter substrate-binding protein [Bdellovibrionales bacterium]
MLRLSLVVIIAILSPSILWADGCPSGKNELIFGVHPYKTPPIINRSFSPMVIYLSGKLNCPVKLYISPDYASHQNKLFQGELDLAYAGPALYANKISLKPHHYLGTLENSGKSFFNGHIIALKSNNKINRIADLKGKRFAFGDKNSTMSYIVPLYEMKKNDITIDLFESYKHLGNHEDVALAVLFGTFDAGAVKEAVYQKYRPRGVKSIFKTRDIPEHVFVANSTFSKRWIGKLQNILTTMHKEKKGKVVLQKIKKDTSKIVILDTKKYQILRDIFKQSN